MTIRFIKMHGLGNDYVYIDCFHAETARQIAGLDVSALARRVSDRHFGIGSDGMVLIAPARCYSLVASSSALHEFCQGM